MAPRPRFVLGWLAGYDRSLLPRDALAGLVLAGLLVPQGLGYAGIAGVEIQRGLYAASVGLLVYALLGTCRHLVVSPTSSSAAILAAAVAPVAGGDAALYGGLASFVAICAGLLLAAGWVLRLGFVSDFIAKPVLKGFTFGLALTIILKQAPALLGVKGGSGGFVDKTVHLFGSLGDVSPTTAAVGFGALGLMLLLPRLTKVVPPGLAALVLGIAAVAVLGLDGKGVSVLGAVPTGLPTPTLPGVRPSDPAVFWNAGLGIALIVFVEALGAGRTLGAKHGYDVVPNRELLALGAANVVSGLFRGIGVGGGLSASAANDAAGARSPASVVVAAVVIVLTLAFLMPLFARLPDAVLAAIVIDAVRRLVDVRELARYFRLRSGPLVHLTALFGVLFLGVLQGMLVAVIVSILVLLRALSRPEVSELGRLRGTRVFVPLESEPEVEPVPGLLILRPQGQMFFANADRVRDRIREALASDPKPKQVLLNLGASPVIGVATYDLLAQAREDLARSSVELALARVTPQVSEMLRRDGLLEKLGEERVFTSQNEAVEAFLRRHGPDGPS